LVLRLGFAGGFFTANLGGAANIRRITSSNPIPSFGSSFGEFGGGLGLDGLPDFVSLKQSPYR
jgi:hypothetical protein